MFIVRKGTTGAGLDIPSGFKILMAPQAHNWLEEENEKLQRF